MTYFEPAAQQSARGILTVAIVAVLAVAGMTARPHASDGERVRRPRVPANIEAPVGNRPFLSTRAYGTQGYICVASGSAVAWEFFGPQATLFNEHDRQILTHFLSPNPNESGLLRPTWQHSRDTSAVWAMPLATSSDPLYVAADAIPWLLLQVTGAQEGPTKGDKLVPATYIQRINTAGGKAPAAGCAAATDVKKKALVAYEADYVFYRDAWNH
jgi:hypothetical protein